VPLGPYRKTNLTDAGDGYEPTFSKELRLEPQIPIGLITVQDGFAMVCAFEATRPGFF
jgi:hypothetical protein